MAMSEYSLSDIATASRENGFGGDTAWCMIILFAMIIHHAVSTPSITTVRSTPLQSSRL